MAGTRGGVFLDLKPKVSFLLPSVVGFSQGKNLLSISCAYIGVRFFQSVYGCNLSQMIELGMFLVE